MGASSLIALAFMGADDSKLFRSSVIRSRKSVVRECPASGWVIKGPTEADGHVTYVLKQGIKSRSLLPYPRRNFLLTTRKHQNQIRRDLEKQGYYLEA